MSRTLHLLNAAVLLIELPGRGGHLMEPPRELRRRLENIRLGNTELSAFENMCFSIFSNWLTGHWIVQGDKREYAMDSTSTDTDSENGILWKTIWQSILDLKVGKLRLEKWYRENYSDFESQLCSDDRISRDNGHAPGSSTKSRADATDTGTYRADFEAMMQEALEEAKLYSEILELHNTERALRAATLSIEEAHSVGRITQLAYVFLPLTFVTGVFGMNITSFGGGAPMWKFWLTTWLILLPAWGFGLWTARGQINESLKRRGVIAKLKTASADLKSAPSKMKASISALVRVRTGKGQQEEKSRPANRASDEEAVPI